MATDIKPMDNLPTAQMLREAQAPRQPAPTQPVPASRRLDPVPQDGPAVARLVERLRDYVQAMDREVQFSIDEASGYTVIKVIDPVSQKVIRQIPAEVTLRLARELGNTRQGLLFTDQA